MKWSEHAEKLCPVAQTLGVIGEPWSLLILRNCFLGTRRFDEFQAQLGLTRHVLADRLKKLVSNEVLEKVPYGDNAGRFEYRLTEKGADLYPVILAMANWGNTWLFEEGEQPLKHIHKECGGDVKPVVSCSSCGDDLQPKSVAVEMGTEVKEMAASLTQNELVQSLGYRPPLNKAV